MLDAWDAWVAEVADLALRCPPPVLVGTAVALWMGVGMVFASVAAVTGSGGVHEVHEVHEDLDACVVACGPGGVARWARDPVECECQPSWRRP